MPVVCRSWASLQPLKHKPKTMETKQPEAVMAEIIPHEAALSLITKAEIDSQVSTAKAFPRSLANFHKKVLEIATLSQDIAEACTYALPRAGKTVEGPSVRLAEIVASAYGNLRCGDRVIFTDDKTITAQGIVHDLENNIMYTAEVKRSILQNVWEPDPTRPGKSRKTGRMTTMNEDMQVVTGRAACAIAFRNAMFKVVPAAIIEDVYQKIKLVARGTEATLTTRRDKAIKFFMEKGIKLEQILAKLEVNGIEEINLDKMQLLSGMKSALANNEAKLDELFAADDPKAKGAKATDATLKTLNKKDAAKGTASKMEKDLKGEDQDLPTV